MGYLADLAASLATQIDLVPTYGEKDLLIRQLAEVRQAIGGSGGGGGGVATSPADIAAGIDGAIDVNTLITSINTIRDRTPVLGAAAIAQSQPVSIASDQIVNVRDRSTTTPIAQASIILAAGGTGQFVIPTNARSLTICVTSGGLVHYTEDGTVPTAANCWFAGGSKEIWDYAVPAGATIRFLAVSAATISIQVRV